MGVEIIYPPLVEQYYAFAVAEGRKPNKADLYQDMVRNGVIEENGSPTERALDEGWVTIHEEVEGMSFEEFLQVYPVLAQYSAESFCLIDGFWEISLTFRTRLFEELQTRAFSSEEREELRAFLSNRNN